MSLSLPHNTSGDKRRNEDSDSYNPAAKRRRVSLMAANFNGYSFFPIDEDELFEGDRRCSLLSNLPLSLLGQQMGQNLVAPVDRRRSSTLSILSFLADGDLLSDEDFIPQYFPTDVATERENIQSDRRRSSTLSIISLLAKEDLFDNTIIPQCFLCESTEDNIADNENILRSMIADELICIQNCTTLTIPTTTSHQDNQNVITHTEYDASDDSDDEGAIQPREVKSIIPTDLDVLFGRGQKMNKHPGNQRFRELVNQMKPIYLAQGSSKKKKHALSQQVMETVYAYGGRFLEVGNDSSSMNESTDVVFVEVDKKRARKKCSQRLRETR